VDIRPPELFGALVQGGGDVTIRNIDVKTPLYLAVEERRLALIPPLLARGSDIFAADNRGITPLERARGGGGRAARSALSPRESVNRRDCGGNTPLHIAVQNKAGRAVVEDMLNKNAQVNARNKEGETSLHLAVRENQWETGALLLARGADVFAPNARGESPLFLSFPPGDNPRSWVFTQGTLRARDGLGNTALHHIAQWKRESQIRWLVNQGAALEAVNATGETPLFMAAKADSADTIRALLNAGANRDARDKLGNTALHAAVHWNAKNAAEALLAAGSDPNSRALNGRSPLHGAVQLNYLEIEAVLIREKADVDIRDNEGNSPLMEAVKGKTLQSVERLIYAYGADIFTGNIRGDTPLHAAVQGEQDEAIRLLLERDASLSIHIKNALGKSPLQLALARPVPETARRLTGILLGRERVHSPDENGASPLHIAISEGASHDMIRFILERGARLTAIDAGGRTPLRIAVDRKDWVLAKILAGAGSDVFFSAGDGKNPAELAISEGGEAIEALFSRDTINNRDPSGNTALHYAARLGTLEIAGHLISQGARKDLKNIAGEGPADIARRWKRDQELIGFLGE
jgi:ankyrin repeat protein